MSLTVRDVRCGPGPDDHYECGVYFNGDVSCEVFRNSLAEQLIQEPYGLQSSAPVVIRSAIR